MSMSFAVLLLIVVLIAHLYEEVRTGFRREFPLGEMPLPVFIGINVLLYAFCFFTLYLSLRGHNFATPLAWVFALLMLVNGLGHIGAMIYWKAYFPGGISAFLLLPASLYLIFTLI